MIHNMKSLTESLKSTLCESQDEAQRTFDDLFKHSHDKQFPWQMLGRWRSDIEYELNNDGGFYEKSLWAKSLDLQIALIRKTIEMLRDWQAKGNLNARDIKALDEYEIKINDDIERALKMNK